MLVDMHLHECRFSLDSFINLELIVAVAKAKGLDAVCITDHDSMGLKEFAAEYSKKENFPIFVGVEYFSAHGDITAWGIDTFPDTRIDSQIFIDHVNANGGFCVSCHPFRNNNRGLEDHLQGQGTPRRRSAQRKHRHGSLPHCPALCPGVRLQDHRRQRCPRGKADRQVRHLAS